MKLSNFSGKTIAIMVASGFDETAFIAIQRAMMAAGGKLKVVSREAGLTNAWNGTGWGMSYPADATLSTTLAIDFDALIVPSGSRHIESLKTEAHAKRVLRAFFRENMPVLLQGEATSLIDLIEGGADLPRASNADKFPVVDRNLVTTTVSSETLDELKALNDLMNNDAGESFAA
ncbi:MAG: DJ-1/PfpI family protein [Candidatus Puniceispirillaceae bacterium]